MITEQCYAAIREFGEASLAAVARHECAEEVENVVEATVLLSGLGFESGGLSLSHALLRGLTAVASLSGALHGEMVAFGTIVQLVLERRSSRELQEHAELLARLALPVTLRELGQADLTEQELALVGGLTLKAPYIGNFERALSGQDVERAIIDADALGRSVKPNLS